MTHLPLLAQVNRFRKRVERDEDYIAVLQRLVEVADPYLKQNNAVDIYEMYFEVGVERDLDGLFCWCRARPASRSCCGLTDLTPAVPVGRGSGSFDRDTERPDADCIPGPGQGQAKRHLHRYAPHE